MELYTVKVDLSIAVSVENVLVEESVGGVSEGGQAGEEQLQQYHQQGARVSHHHPCQV